MEHGTHHLYSSSVNEQLVSSKKNCDIDSHLEGDDAELFYSPSPRNDLLGRENKRGGLQQLEKTPGRQLGMKAGFGKRSEKETSRWASVHDALHLVEATTNVEMAFVSKNSLAFRDAHASNEAQTMPFKAIQSSPLMDHKLLGLEESKKKTSSGIVMSGAATGRLASAQQQQPAVGNVVNAAGTGSHVRPGTDAEAYDCDSPSSFDFSKAGVYQAAVGSVPKLHTPSKWDDAEKWLSASDQTPTGSGSKAAGSKSRSGPLQAHVVANEGGAKMSKKALFSNPGAAAAGRPQFGTKNGTASNAVVHQGGLLDASFSSASSGDNSGERRDDQSTSEQYSGPKKVVDLSNAAKYRTSVEGSEALTRVRGGGGHQQARLAFMRASDGTPNMSSAVMAVDRYPLNDLHGHDHMSDGIVEGSSIMSPDHQVTDHDNYLKTALRTAKPISESRTDYHDSPNRLKLDPDILMNPIPPVADSSTVAAVTSSPGMNKRGAVSTRDMGTEMTPIASVEPSRTATPVRSTTPNLGSPINSPDRVTMVPATSSVPKSVSYEANNGSPAPSTAVGLQSTQESGDRHHRHHNSYDNNLATTKMTTTTTTTTTRRRSGRSPVSSSKVLSGKDLQTKTRQEILALGTQLGKANITAWATKEEEEADAAKALKANVDLEEVRKTLLAARASSWEEAEQAKYAVRYKREDAKIQAWENHEKAKAEAEMRRIEVKVEHIWSHANEKLLNKLAATHRRAEDLRVALEAQRIEQIAKATSKAQQIRTTGKMPKKFFARWCWR